MSQSFKARFRTERQEALASLLTRHPDLDLRALAEVTSWVKIVSVEGGLLRDYAPHHDFLDYDAYRANAQRRIAPVEVRLATGAPTFLVLLSGDPVAWTVALEGTTTITGVLVSSYYISTTSGLPSSIPLDILAHENGDSKYYRNLAQAGDETVLLQDMSALSGVATDVQIFERVSVIAAR